MNYAVKMRSGIMIHLPSFIDIGSANLKLRGDALRHKDTDISHTDSKMIS
jgi:hypothetical protein